MPSPLRKSFWGLSELVPNPHSESSHEGDPPPREPPQDPDSIAATDIQMSPLNQGVVHTVSVPLKKFKSESLEPQELIRTPRVVLPPGSSEQSHRITNIYTTQFLSATEQDFRKHIEESTDVTEVGERATYLATYKSATIVCHTAPYIQYVLTYPFRSRLT
ncbi:unnamed protein product [Rhizoctonia solani]|uniref:Uncharacterized protein n=1 Tax=Rhizoctonia solani TaxID=456999 RepID=A0A8H3A3J4_9AGAM|nr:unnamed protein product [Rhizoctonia solani]